MSKHTPDREWTLKVDDEYQYLDGVRAYGLIVARGAELEELANKLGKSVYYHVLTGGGSHAGWKKPEEKK